MTCSLGQVVDLSTTGLRLLARKQLFGDQVVVFTGVDQKPIRLRARVLWHRRHAVGEHVHGLRFHRVTFNQREQLEALVDIVTAGSAPPTPTAVNRFGLAGLTMLGAAFVMVLAALAWTYLNASIELAAPSVHEVLHSIPELSALLAIAAGGCGLLGLTQKLMPIYGDPTQLGSVKRSDRRSGKHAPPQDELDRVRRSHSVLNCILESSLGGVCVLETIRNDSNEIDGFQIQLINPAGEALVGKNEKELVGKSLRETLPGLVGHEIYQDLLTIVQDGIAVQKQYQIGDDGQWYLVAMVQLADGIAVTFMDVTESQRHREKLQHIAYHDELTGLPNRKALIEHVDASLLCSRRSAGHQSAVLFLDFDHFKNVNDTLGHEAGDQLLIGIAQRLRDNLRDTDAISSGVSGYMPARLGGDEFVVLIDGINNTQDAVTVARRLLKVFKAPHHIAGQEVVSTASIGIAINHGEYDNPEDILRDADSALYTAKQNGKARYVLFDQDMQDKLVHRIRLEQDLRNAIENDQLTLVYEPIIDLLAGKTAGFEALVRWNHPTLGTVAPDEFIPLAENINLIGPLGEWVIHEACAQLADWTEQGLTQPFLNINLSRGQLYEPNLVAFFQDQLTANAVEPSRLRLELTETMVMNDLGFMADKLTQLKALGMGLALDDFGTGYSSLSVLHKLPFDTLKIDRAFLEDAHAAIAIDQTHRSSAIISAITELANHLKLDVIAEGIADTDQVATLQALACRYAQGWHFSKPLSSIDATDLLHNPAAHPSCNAAKLDRSA